MKNFNFYLFLFTAGAVFVHGETDSENASNKTKSESDPKSLEKDKQGYLITPDERLSVDQRLFQKPKLIQNNAYVPPTGGRRQNIYLSDDTGRYNVQVENFQYERPTHFQAALGAISAHIINQKQQEYIPYPPNEDPQNYPSYRGHPHATEPPIIRAYERSSGSHYVTPPPEDYSRRILTDNIYQRAFPEFERFSPGFYAPEEISNSEGINRWYEEQRGAERIF